MTLSRKSIVLISLCVGLAAALLTYQYLQQVRARTTQLSQSVPVVVATRPIAARTIIEPGSVRETTLPAATLPANCAISVDEVVGQVAVASLAEDEPIQRQAVAARNARLGLAYTVPGGMRAVAVALDPIIGVAGFLKPGDRVDVVATFTVSGNAGDKLKVTKTVLQDVTLLAIGPEVRPETATKPASGTDVRPKEQPNATLAVTPLQAEQLILAESGGKLRLTLRPADDRTVVALPGVRSDMLIGTAPVRAARTTAPTQRQSAPAPRDRIAAPPPRTVHRPARTPDYLSVETIRGTQRSTAVVSAD